MACVYGLIRESDPTIRYIGISKKDTPNRRFTIHSRAAKHGVAYPVYDWMRKYSDVTFIVLYSNLSWEDACRIEIDLIAKYRSSASSKLLNVSDGGQGPNGYKHSQEIKDRLSKAHTGVLRSEEHRKNISLGATGKSKSEAHRKNISKARLGLTAPNKGNKFTEEQKKKVSDGLKRSWARRKALKTDY